MSWTVHWLVASNVYVNGKTSDLPACHALGTIHAATRQVGEVTCSACLAEVSRQAALGAGGAS